MTLYQNVSVVVEKLAGVRFFGNHARKSGGAIYARGSQIAVRNGGNLLFIENKAYNGGAMALLPVVSFDESPFKLEVPVVLLFFLVKILLAPYVGQHYIVTIILQCFSP